MFKRRPLQSKSEIWMRNIAMGFLIIYMTIFLIIPVVIVIAGSFHQWNPLNQTYMSVCFPIRHSGSPWQIP